MRNLFFGQILAAKVNLNEVGNVPQDQMIASQQQAIYIKFSAGTSAGAVVVEDAHDPSYAGTWANLTTVNWAAADRVHKVALTGYNRAPRVRISVAIVGGTVDAWVGGN